MVEVWDSVAEPRALVGRPLRWLGRAIFELGTTHRMKRRNWWSDQIDPSEGDARWVESS